MLWVAYLVLTSVFYTVNSQQDQNYYVASSDNRQQARFAAYQPSQYTAGQQTFTYFPQTNAGPFLPFRAAAATYQLDGANSNGARSSQKYPTAFVASQPAAVEVASDPRFDSLISSPGAAYGGATNEDYSETSYSDAVPDTQPSQRFNSVNQDRQQQSSYRAGQIVSRFPSVAISEVTRTQDNPSNPNVLQTHSFNVHHTSNPSGSRFAASAADELPLTQNHRWRTQTASGQQDASTNFRARNLPFYSAGGKPSSGSAEVTTEDAFAKFKNRFAAKEHTFLVNAQNSASAEKEEAQPESDSNISLYLAQDAYFPPEKKKEPAAPPSSSASKTKNNVTGTRFKTINGNIAPTTYAPSILIDNRIRNTLPTTTTTEYAVDIVTTIRPSTIPNRGRNKYYRPSNEVDNKEVGGSTKRRRVTAVHVKTTPLAATVSPVSTNFDVVTMSQDHVFVSEDNFKGFVDSAVIDSTETSTTEDLKDVLEGANAASAATTHAPVKKKVLSPVERKVVKEVEHDEVPTTTPTTTTTTTTTTTESTKKSTVSTRSTDATSTSTEAWVVVASVMTSRSVSGARFIPSSAIKQDQIPVAADIKSIKDIKEIRSHAHKASDGERNESSTVTRSSAKINTTAKPSHSQSTESIIDKLDQVQSELSSGILNAFPSQEKPALDMAMISPTVKSSEATSTTEATSKETYSRRFVPSAKTTSKPKLDRNKSSVDNASSGDDHGDSVPTSFKPRGSTQSSRTSKSSEAVETTLSSSTTEKASRKEGKGKSSTGGYKYKGKYDDVSAFLPSGFNPSEEEPASEEPSPAPTKPSSTQTTSKRSKVKFDDVSAFLPPGYKLPAEGEDPSPEASTEENAPPQKSTKSVSSSEKVPEAILSKAKPADLSAFLPPGFKLEPSTENADVDAVSEQSTEPVTTKSPSSGTKVVFAGRPGGAKKPPTSQPKNAGAEKPKSNIPSYQRPLIQKGWPKRDPTREFTGWSTAAPSTISIKELLMAAQAANATSTTTEESSTAPTTTTTAPTTTPRRVTTPGICSNDCELTGSIRLVGGVQWSPALLDHNTVEWKTLAKDVENELQKIFQSSEMLSKWYRRIWIDAFSPGSVIVDYFIDLSELGKTVNTAEMRRFFHESLIQESITSGTFISSTNESDYRQLKLGKYTLDPMYTDFMVQPRNLPAVRLTEQETWLPQWAFAVIVIGLASLIFVIVFGITVIISRRTKAKKHPTALTEEMLNELNKSHMGGFENYGADDLYNMEDVWNEKPFKHKRASFYHDSGAQDIYDSWRSNWEHPSQYGHSGYNGSLRSGYFRRRPDYDTNF